MSHYRYIYVGPYAQIPCHSGQYKLSDDIIDSEEIYIINNFSLVQGTLIPSAMFILPHPDKMEKRYCCFAHDCELLFISTEIKAEANEAIVWMESRFHRELSLFNEVIGEHPQATYGLLSWFC